MEHTPPSRIPGYWMTLAGGTLWAIGGACGQYLFWHNRATAGWLVPFRMLLAGVILLAAAKLSAQPVTAVWHNRRDGGHMLIYAIFGAAASQYTFYGCIEHSNVAFATVISYIYPVLILLFCLVREIRLPHLYEVASVVLVLVGTVACTTHWDFTCLSVSTPALVLGLLCGLASAFNTLNPQPLLQRYPLLSIMGWGMLIGGGLLFLLFRPWTISVVVNFQLIVLMSVIIVASTVLAFCLFMAGVRVVGGVAGSVLASVEPVAAVIISVLALHISFTGADFLGFLLILITIPLIAFGQKRSDQAQAAREEENRLV